MFNIGLKVFESYSSSTNTSKESQFLESVCDCVLYGEGIKIEGMFRCEMINRCKKIVMFF